MKKIVNVSLFILKTVYFSPINNPIFYCLIVVASLLFACGDLKKHETVLFLLLSAISHRFMPAIHLSSSNSSNDQNEFFSQNIRLLPIKERTFFLSFLLSGIFYIGILLNLGYMAGEKLETPPLVKSLCTTHLVSMYSPSGEPYSYVEGVTTYGYKFRVPVSPSLFFGHLASEVIFLNEKANESYIQKYCPCRKMSPEEVFSVPQHKSTSLQFSPFLENVRQRNQSTLLLIISFSLLFFLYDGMCIFQGKIASKKLKYIFTILNLFTYAIYGLLCFFLIIDILIPESILFQINTKVHLYKLLFPILSLMIIGCVIRLLTVLVLKESK